MNKYLDQLVKLSKCDTQISAFEPKIEDEKAKLSVFLQTADQITSSIDKNYAEIEDVKSKRTKNNTHLIELKAKLVDISKKHGDVKTEKEVKALQLEEEIAKEQISFANEEITRLDAIAETKEEELKEFKVNLTSEEESIKGLQIEVDNAIEDLNKQRNDVYQNRAELLENFDNKILTFYEKIKRWANDTAVVPVKKQACYGCYMKINDYTYAEVIKSEEIINCPHCGRILYKEKEDVTTEA
ncbi:MAG: hypothetical protein HRT43_03410 [Campylobacteraceae bacterium]|nr:hypothetical protein [Campylobacteraceae bacterium]